MFATNDPRYAVAMALEAYRPEPSGVEEAFRMLMIEHLFNQNRCLWRDCFFPGHFTGSAWVVNPDRSKVLLLRHLKLERWMQAGGHADGDGVLARVAAKELAEETGLGPELAKPLLLGRGGQGILDVDIHVIPQKEKNGRLEPQHLHFDVRFAFEADDARPLGSPEGLELRWLSLTEAAQLCERNDSIVRMLGKTPGL